MQIAKTEIEWVRKHPFENWVNSQPIEFWKQTAKALANLGCGIADFDCASFQDIERLGATIFAFENSGINTSVVLDNKDLIFDSDTKEALFLLYKKYGLCNVSVEYDIGMFQSEETSKTLDLLQTWKSFGKDCGTIALVNIGNRNFKRLPSTIKELSKLGIWTTFDLLQFSEDMDFTESEMIELKYALIEVSKLMMSGYKCYTSSKFMNLICREGFKFLKKRNWKCTYDRNFPATLYIDAEGLVYPCKTFNPKTGTWLASRIDQDFEAFKTWAKDQCTKRCKGCLCNNNYDGYVMKEEHLSNWEEEE